MCGDIGAIVVSNAPKAPVSAPNIPALITVASVNTTMLAMYAD